MEAHGSTFTTQELENIVVQVLPGKAVCCAVKPFETQDFCKSERFVMAIIIQIWTTPLYCSIRQENRDVAILLDRVSRFFGAFRLLISGLSMKQ